jgi:L-2,4-diaminobutyrate decarboxylase
MNASDELTAARQRISAAYDPSLFEEACHRLASLLAANLARAERSEGPVLPWIEPVEGIRRAAAFLHDRDAGPAPADLPADFARLVKTMLERGLNLHDPRYIGHQVPAPVPLAGLFDAVGSVTNQVMAIYEMGPWATAVEQAMIRDGHSRRIPRQPHCPADRPKRRPWRCLGTRAGG